MGMDPKRAAAPPPAEQAAALTFGLLGTQARPQRTRGTVSLDD